MPEPSKRNSRPRVAIAAYDMDWVRGSGTQRFVGELARHLLALQQSEVDYLLLLPAGADPVALDLPPEKCLTAPEPGTALGPRACRRFNRLFWNGVDRIRVLTGCRASLRGLGRLWVKRWMESLDVDIVYYPSAWNHDLVRTKSMVLTIHDMQHVHFPQWWQSDRFQRQVVMPAFCDRACAVTCSSRQVAADIVEHLGVRSEKAIPIFLSPPDVSSKRSADPAAVRARHGIPARYAIYPAAVWPHKNHLALVEAVALCRKRGDEVVCVCTGETADWLYQGQFEQITRRIAELGLKQQVIFTGSVSDEDLFALEKGADFFFVPTLFEAGSYPVWEACSLGRPVACSNVALLPYQIRDAGLLFDPGNIDEMADVLGLLWRDPLLRDELAGRALKIAGSHRDSGKKMASGYHWLFVKLLVERGKLPLGLGCAQNPAPPLDASGPPPKFDWKNRMGSLHEEDGR